jgi:protein-tyrosine phosphatase
MAFLSKLFGPKKLGMPVDLSLLGCDVHSHLIPGIDDGARTLDEALDLMRNFEQKGYSKLIITPHIMTDYYRNTPPIIQGGLDDLRSAANAAGIGIELEAAAEYMVDSGFGEKVKEGKLLSFGSSYVLIEFSYLNPPPNYKQILFDLQTSGYRVVLAHPERYSYWQEDMALFSDLNDRGVLLQINLVSLSGFYGKEVKETARQLIDRKLYRLAGSDMHNQDYMQALEAAQYEPLLEKLLETNPLLNSKL